MTLGAAAELSPDSSTTPQATVLRGSSSCCNFRSATMATKCDIFTQHPWCVALGVWFQLVGVVGELLSTSYIFSHSNKPFFCPFAEMVFALWALLFGIHGHTMSKRICGKEAAFFCFYFWQTLRLPCCLCYKGTVSVFLSEPLQVPVKFLGLPSEQPNSTNTDTEEKNSEVSCKVQ